MKKQKRFLPLVVLLLWTITLFSLPLTVAAADVPDFSSFTFAQFFTAGYEVSGNTGNVSVSGGTFTLTSTGVDSSGSGCNATDAQSATTTLTLTAKETVSITYSVDGSDSQTYILEGTQTLSFVVTASDGTTVSKTVTISAVVPVSADLDAPDDSAAYTVGSNTFEYLDQAIAYAFANDGTITVTKSGKAYHSSYAEDPNGYASKTIAFTIPSNVKLLLPYASGKSNFDEKPDMSTTSNYYYNTQSVYSELRIPSNTTINCAGKICVDSKIFANTLYSGCPGGPHGKIVLESGSALNMQSGSTLYCWGYITGVWDSTAKTFSTGTVTAQSGSTVYESFQALGWRGGTLMKKWMNSGDAKSFAFSDYALQNIESNLQINNGATLNFTTSLEGSGTNAQVAGTFVGNTTGFLQLGTSGSVTRTYDPHNNRIRYGLSGTMNIANVSMTLASLGSVDSQNYVFGINPSMDIVVNSEAKVTLLYDYKLMPGASFTVNNGGKATVNGKVYIYDTADYVIDGLTYAHHQSYTWLKSIPVSYIAATGYKSDGFGQVWNQGISQISASTLSGKVVIDGELIVNGGMYTTSNGGKNSNKVITGTGTIINDSSAASILTDVLDEAKSTYSGTGGYSSTIDYQKKVVTPAVGLISGVSTSASDYRCFEAGKVYHGTSDGYWYEYVITAENAETATLITPVTGGSTAAVTGVKNTVGIVSGGIPINFNNSNVATSLGTVQTGVFTFKVADGYDVFKNSAEEANLLTPADDGVYTLSATDDTVIILQSQCAHENTEVLEPVEPTCTATGLTAGEKCLDCDKILIAQEEVEMAAHTPGDAAACETAQVCTICGAELTAKLGHDASGQWLTNEGNTKHYKICARTDCDAFIEEAEHTGGEATCTAQATCGVCGNKYGKTLGHDYETTYRYDETNHWYKCKNCSTSTTGVAAHAYGNGVETPPTCTEDGYTTYTCACGYSYKADSVTAPGHVYVDHAAKAPTCTTVGWDAYKTCENCSYTSYVEKPALGHTEKTLAAVAATCTTTGLTEGKKCTVCNVVTVEQETVKALGHTEVTDAAVAATCTATGLTQGKHCSVCKEVLVAQTVTDKLAHSYVAEVVAPTCTTVGYTNHTCSACGDNYKDTEMAATGHTSVKDDAKAPTCTETGLTEGSHCGVCGETIAAQKTVDALGHTVVTDAYKAPTCAATGLTEGKHCSVCGEVLVAQEVIEKTQDHTWSSGACTVCNISSENVCEHVPDESKTVVVDPTCTSTGFTTYTCSLCELTFVGYTAEALGHTEGAAATCTTDQICTVCKVVLKEAIGHNYVAVVTAPTCTAEGYTTHTCSNCRDRYVDSHTDKIAHNSGEAQEEDRHEATCIEAGSYNSVIRCTVCNTVISSTPNTIPASGHEMDANWTQTTAPTCTETGEERKDCAKCDHFETQTIAVLGHNLPENWTVIREATCTASGEQQRKCSRCDYVEEESIEKIAHSYRKEVTPPTCTEGGYTTYTCTECGHTYKDDEVANLGHTEGAAVRENVTNASCGADGSYDSVIYCAVCNTELSRTPTTIPATGEHNYESEVTKEATCTDEGVTTYTCTACGATETEAIKAQGHDEVEHEAKAPTCIAIGWDAYVTCSRCDHSTYVEIKATGDHNDSQEDKDHICDTEGCTEVMSDCSGGEATCKDKAVCKTCGEAYGELDAENHTGGTEIRDYVAATCTKAGYTGDTYCLGCDVKIESGTPTGMLAHRWVDATYTAPKTCSVCGATEGEPLVKVENLGQANDEQINSTVEAIVNSTDTVQPEDSGIETGSNMSVVDDAKKEMQIQGSNVSYETTLEIKLNAVTVDESSIVTKITYDVTPMLYALDTNKNVVGSTELNNFNEEITFHLPVDKNTTAGFARVWHTHDDETIDMGLHKITHDGDHKYIEVKSAKFSAFTVEVVEECTEHTGGTATCKDQAVCTICGTPYGDLGEHNYVDGVCTVCKESKTNNVDILITSKSLHLEGAISINLFLAFEGQDFLTREYIEKNGGVLVWREDNAPADTESAVHGSESYYIGVKYEGPYDGHIEYLAVSEEIPAACYAEQLYFRPFIKVDGEYQYGEILEYNVKAYCEGRFEKSSNTKLKHMLVAILNYGAASQNYFSYKTDVLANADLQTYVDNGWITESMLEMNWNDSYLDSLIMPTEEMISNFVQTAQMTSITKSLHLEGAISINYFVTIGEDAEVFKKATEKVMYFWTSQTYTELLAAGTPLSKENADYTITADLEYTTGYGWEFTATSDSIPAAYWGNSLYSALCVTDENGDTHCSGIITYSPDYFANRKINDSSIKPIDDVAKWLVIYSERAKTYFFG